MATLSPSTRLKNMLSRARLFQRLPLGTFSSTRFVSTLSTAPKARVAVIYYSLYGHVTQLAERAKAGIESTGASASIYQVPETLPDEVLKLMKAPAKHTEHPVLDRSTDITTYDGFVFAVPTRFGTPASQFKSWLDGTGGLWAGGKLVGKFVSLMTSTGTLAGGQETTLLTLQPVLTHHGMIHVPPGYTFPERLADEELVLGGSPWGAGTLAGGDGSRQPHEVELAYAEHQGKYLADVVNTHVAGKAAVAQEE